MTLYHLGRLEEAENLLQNCLVGQVQVLGPSHRKTNNTRLGLRVVRKAQLFKKGFKKRKSGLPQSGSATPGVETTTTREVTTTQTMFWKPRGSASNEEADKSKSPKR